jgi:hypothetical protein
MIGFRRFIIGVAEFVQILYIFGLTIGGGYAGYLFGRILESTPYIRDSYLGSPEVFLGGIPARDVFLVVFGAISGLTTSASVAAILFALVQIEKNTRGAPALVGNAKYRIEPRL